MEPITTATTFATIVGLVQAFKQERKGNEAVEKQEFLDWLSSHRHEVIRKRIEENKSLLLSIQTILEQDQEVLLEKLDNIDRILAGLSSQLDGFESIAVGMYPDSEISEQARSILAQFVASGSSTLGVSKSLGGGLGLHAFGGDRQITYEEKRFVEADLKVLCDYGLLNLDYNDRGDPIYRITRNAVRYVESTSKK